MKKFLSSFVLLMGSLFAVHAQEKPIPGELKPFIKAGYEAMDFVKGDLNGDGLQDYLLVLKTRGEDTMTFDNPDWEAKRPLLLIVRQPGGSLKEQVRNDELVLCRQCGGVMGDPYEGLTIRPGAFTASFYGGSSWRWGENYTFRYDKIKKDWFLTLHNSVSYHTSEPNKTTGNYSINRNEIGDLALATFSPYYNTDSSEWKVAVAKTYFFQSPVLGSRPKKTYLVKGNIVISSRRFSNFVQCAFANDKGDITSGFLLKKDLQLVKDWQQ